jgi:hypothetical protein
MKYFWTDGGNNHPWFEYRVKVHKCTDEMYRWCEAYDDEGKYFRRWRIDYGRDNKDYDVVHFEWEQAALMFALKFGVR